MDIIFIRNLQIDTLIGIHPHEREAKQPIVLNLHLANDIKRAAASDGIEDALNYQQVTESLVEYVGSTEFLLVEKLAEAVAEYVMSHFSVPWLRLELSKPEAMPGSTVVGLVIERGNKPDNLPL